MDYSQILRNSLKASILLLLVIILSIIYYISLRGAILHWLKRDYSIGEITVCAPEEIRARDTRDDVCGLPSLKNSPHARTKVPESTFQITSQNGVFKYHHLNGRVYTLKMPRGKYTGEELARMVQSELNFADGGWWIKWDKGSQKFTIGNDDFEYMRIYHEFSIYNLMGLPDPPEHANRDSVNDWVSYEEGEGV